MTAEQNNKAACSQHPLLSPDAWHMVRQGRPFDDGIKALTVCRFACPIRDKCPVPPMADAVAAGGWYNGQGVFVDIPEGFVDIYQVASYIGILPGSVNTLIRRHNIPITKIKRPFDRVVIPVEAMKELAIQYGPPHGTLKMHDIHLLRGEPVCRHCAEAAKRKSDLVEYSVRTAAPRILATVTGV